MVWPKMPAYLRIKEWSEPWGLCKKGVRSEWKEARDAQDISGIQMDLEQKYWCQCRHNIGESCPISITESFVTS